MSFEILLTNLQFYLRCSIKSSSPSIKSIQQNQIATVFLKNSSLIQIFYRPQQVCIRRNPSINSKRDIFRLKKNRKYARSKEYSNSKSIRRVSKWMVSNPNNLEWKGSFYDDKYFSFPLELSNYLSRDFNQHLLIFASQ